MKPSKLGMVISVLGAFATTAAHAENGECRVEDKNKQIELCSIEIAKAPNDRVKGIGYLYRCQAFDILGNYSAALGDCERARDFLPEDGSVYNSIAIVHSNMGENSKAIAASSQAIKLTPSNGTFYNVRSHSYCEIRETNASVEDRLKAMRNGAFSAAQLQQYLQDAGYYSGSIDGNFGSASVNALERWTIDGCGN